jgi:sugar/nucleoside kinase (ribokinase family)
MTELISFSGPPLCVVGNLNRDLKVHEVPESPSLFEDGETSVPRISETIGGGGAISACAAAGLGANVRFLAKVGTDALAERLRRTMEQHGVRTLLASDPLSATGTTVALGFATGHRHFLSCLPNNLALRFEDLDLTALDGCGHLLRADVWFSQAMLEDGNRRLLQEARRRGLATSLDINFDPCWSDAPARIIDHRKRLLRDVLELVDVAHGNTRELCQFTHSEDLQTALRRLTDWGVKAVVVHLGAQGAGYFAQGEWAAEPPSPVHHPVHSTGTGDVLSLCMILLHHRLDLPIERKLRFANGLVAEFMEGRRQLIPSLEGRTA